MTEGEALVLAGHGSHENPESSLAVKRKAREIREMEVFDEVTASFWKEQPEFQNVLDDFEYGTVYVVPFFMSEGYFSGRVLPRELKANKSHPDSQVSTPEEPDFRLCEPVGTDDRMAETVIDRVRRVKKTVSVESGDVDVLVIGHGTERHEGSSRSLEEHVEYLKSRYGDEFSDLEAVYLDEPPYLDGWRKRFDGDLDVVAVPFFVSDGLHTLEDIPEILEVGMDERTTGGIRQGGDGTTVWYSGALGTEERLTQVILDRARSEGADLEKQVPTGMNDYTREFVSLLDEFISREGSLDWGELRVTAERSNNGEAEGCRENAEYLVRNQDDDLEDEVEPVEKPFELYRLTRFDDSGGFRSWRFETSLPSGWVYRASSPEAVVEAVEYVYPASVRRWWRTRKQNDVDPTTDFISSAERQSGIYAGLSECGRDKVESLSEPVCGRCVKEREWSFDGSCSNSTETESSSKGTGSFSIPCVEPCSFFRAVAKETVEREDSTLTVPDVSDTPEGEERKEFYLGEYLRKSVDTKSQKSESGEVTP
ncbi:MAG: CbiX/SirB N-terminal domain-containing protein [Halobacteria archaeon]